MPDPNLRATLETLDQKLALSLAHSRASFRHATLRGDGAEYAIRDALDSHLPRYLAVGTGEIIDLADTRSGQVDVVISNDDQPFRTDIHDAGVYLIEGVGAAGEVKSRLTIPELVKAIDGATRFKRLRAQDRDVVLVSPNILDRPRFFDCPPYFLFAFENSITPEALMKKLAQADLVDAADDSGRAVAPLDAVFILGQGVAIDYGDGQSKLGYRYRSGPQAGQVATGWAWEPRDSGIFTYFLLWLSAVMPRFVRFSPIALDYFVKLL